jgi:hypothetical protein
MDRGAAAGSPPPQAGFTCEDTLALATETTGFAAPGSGDAGQGAAG